MPGRNGPPNDSGALNGAYLISRVTLPGPGTSNVGLGPGPQADLVVRGGVIERIDPAGSVPADGLIELEGE